MLEKFKALISDIFGSGSEITESTEIMLKERLTSPFYGYFAFSWLIVNWDYIYAAFFLDEAKIFDKTGLLQNEYLLHQIMPEYHSWSWLGHFIVAPFVLTVLFFWVMPFITRPFYKRYIENLKKMDAIRIEASKDVVIEETNLIKEEIKKSEQEKRAVNVNPEILWKREYDEFRKTKVFDKFHQITDAYYKHNGLIRWREFEIDDDILMYADSHGILTLDWDTDDHRIIVPTPKGKYYFRLYSGGKDMQIQKDNLIPF